MPSLEEGQWSTDDMTLAVWLAYCEHSYIVTIQNAKAHWVFVDSDPLQEDVRMYRSNEAGADPDSLIATYLRMRREMFARLDAEKAS